MWIKFLLQSFIFAVVVASQSLLQGVGILFLLDTIGVHDSHISILALSNTRLHDFHTFNFHTLT